MSKSNLKAVIVDDRKSRRTEIELSAVIDAGPGRVHAATVQNLSAHGVMVEARAHYVPGRPVSITLAALGRVAGRVAWMRDGYCGIAFVEPLTLEQIERIF